MERKLASIQKIESVDPIPNADFIEKVKVLGWTLVVRKGEFKKHDKCIYFEIDSILPDTEQFAFMKGKGSNPMRLRTKKMRKVISQGLAMPLSLLHDFADGQTISKLKLGDDVTELIGVVKYEPPMNGMSASKGYWPFYIPKTDEIRVQSAPEALEEMQGLDLCVTIKLDGCSCTFSHKDGEFEVCSRNNALKDMTNNPDFKDDRWWAMAKKLDMETRLPPMGNYAVQGELCGPGIQGNKLGLSELSFFAFNVYDIDNQCYLDFKDFLSFCEKLDVNTVPIVYDRVRFNLPGEDGVPLTQKMLLKLAEGKYDGTTNEREGIVIRPVVETYSETLDGRLSLKTISNRFLLKGGD